MAAGAGRGEDAEGAVETSDADRVRAEISPETLRPEEARSRVGATDAGAVVLFVGTVRRTNRGREVVELAYEAYAAMAAEELARVGAEARERFGLERVDAVHRVGKLGPGEPAVAVAVSSGHREAAFDAVRWMMSELKRRVPIWKRETYADGTSEWLGEDEHGGPPHSGVEGADAGESERRKGEKAS